MSSLNKVQLIGRLGSDPDLKQTTSGKAVVNVNIATSEQWKDNDGNKQERTEWTRVVAWQRLAEIMGQYLHKGDQVYLEGKLTTRKWQDADGTDRYTTEVVASNMIMLGSKPTSDSGAARPEQSRKTSQGDNPYQEEVNF